MGGGASIAADAERARPLDGSDLVAAAAVGAVQEVARLRLLCRSASRPLPADWKRSYDDSQGALYFYNETTGEVSWELPGGVAPAADADAASSEPLPEGDPPTPTAGHLAHAHHVFKARLASSTKSVMMQLKRQQLKWESDWHEQLVAYAKELCAEVELLRKEDEKKTARFTKSGEQRASIAEEEAAAAAKVALAERQNAKQDRHAKLMAKLAAKKKAHQLKLAERKASHTELMHKMQVSFSGAIKGHAGKLKAAAVFLDADGDGVVQDQTGGWVQLFDDATKAVYYWHPEKGSTWSRPEDMEFNLHLHGIFGGKHNNSDGMGGTPPAIDAEGANALERWLTDNAMKHDELEDQALEEEIAALEDELAVRRRKQAEVGEVEMVEVGTAEAETESAVAGE